MVKRDPALTLSIVIPTYNRYASTVAAIESAVTISPRVVEIIVVDDGSDPPFATHLCNDVNSSGVPVRVVRLRTNRGPAAARNAGVRAASGKYVAFLDSDDCFTANKVDVLLQHIASKNGNRVLAHRALGGTFGNDLMLSVLERWGHMRSVLALLLGYGNPFYTPCLCLPKKFALNIPALRYCEDYVVSLNVVRRHLSIDILPGRLSVLGRSPSSKGGLTREMFRMWCGEAKVRAFVSRNRKYPLSTRVISLIMIPLSVLRSVLTKLPKVALQRVAKQ